MKHFLLITILFFAAIGVASAQRIEAVREQLNVREVGSAQEVVANYDARSVSSTISGYRVRIFFDSKQNSRAASVSVQKQFDALYPEIPSYWSFEQPNYIVTVGNFNSKEEATALVGRISKTFPKAFVLRYNIPISLFGVEK